MRSWIVGVFAMHVVACSSAEDGGRPAGGAAGAGASAGSGGASAGAGGSSEGGAGSGGASGAGGGSAGQAPVDLSGRYEIVFPAGDLPSQTAHLDLRATFGTYEAQLTPAFGAPTAFAVTVAPGELTLSSEAGVVFSTLPFHAVPIGPPAKQAPGTSCCGKVDRWQTLILGRAGDGLFDGVVTATGAFAVFNDDTLPVSQPRSTVATLAVDTHAPTLDARPLRAVGPTGRILPWAELDVRPSEPIDPFAAGLAARRGPPGGPATEPTPLSVLSVASSWAGDVGATVWFTEWSIPTGVVEVVAPPGSKDPSGHASLSFAKAFSVLEVPPPLFVHDFGAATATVAAWGASSVLAQGDPACESGGCVVVPVFPCDEEVGFAGRLKTAGKSTISLRYRRLFDLGGAAVPFGVRVVAKDGTIVDELPQPVGFAAPLGAPVAGYGAASPWTTWTTSLPPGDEVGVVVHGWLQYPCGPSYGAVLVDSLSAM